MENILRIWVCIMVLKRMKPQLCFFLKKPSLVHCLGAHVEKNASISKTEVCQNNETNPTHEINCAG